MFHRPAVPHLTQALDMSFSSSPVTIYCFTFLSVKYIQLIKEEGLHVYRLLDSQEGSGTKFENRGLSPIFAQ